MCSLGPDDRRSFSGDRVLEKQVTGIFLQLCTEQFSSEMGRARLSEEAMLAGGEDAHPGGLAVFISHLVRPLCSLLC